MTSPEEIEAEKQKAFLAEWKRAVDFLVEESAFAKAVRTPTGPAILLSGDVIHVSSSNSQLHTEVIVRALRRGGQGSGSIGSGSGLSPSGETTSTEPLEGN